MATDGNDRKATKPSHVGAPPPEPEHLPCPRCDSTNTKFCYYNNYNFSQPRHFCKSCRRYWTHGGTLRDIPVGGGSRKNAKRSRTSVNSAVNVTNGGGGGGGGVSVFSMPHHHHHHEFRHFPAGLVPFGDNGVNGPFVGEGGKMCGSFTSLLNTQGSGGLLGLGGFGPGIEELGFGLGRAVWPFGGVVEGGVSGGSGGGASVGGHTWQLENVEGGFV